MVQALLQAIDVLTLVGRFELALTAAQSIKSEYWRVIALSKLMQAGERIGTANIGKVFDEAVQEAMQKLPGDKWDKTLALCEIAASLAQARQQAAAIRVVGLAEPINEQLDVLSLPARMVDSLPQYTNESLTWLQVEVTRDYYWLPFLLMTDDVASPRMAVFDTFLPRAMEIGYARKEA